MFFNLCRLISCIKILKLAFYLMTDTIEDERERYYIMKELINKHIQDSLLEKQSY